MGTKSSARRGAGISAYKLAAVVVLVATTFGCGAVGDARRSEPYATTATGVHRPPRHTSGIAFVGRDHAAQTLGVPTPTGPFARATLVHAGGYYVRGIDAIDGRMLATDAEGGLHQSSDWGATWSSDKGLPSGLAHHVLKIVRFGNYLYLLAAGSHPGVWRAAPTEGNAPFVWSTELLRLAPGTTGIMTDLDASTWPSDNFLFVGTYGDPLEGPSIWRISEAEANKTGTAWSRSYGPDPRDRHIHAVAADPYVPGDVWATIGDGGPTTLAFSNDRGATWVRVIQDYSWQAVQISFDAKYIYLAGDQPTYAFAVLDRATFTPLVASPNRPADLTIPVAHAPGDRYYAISYFGAVDPVTGAYYCVANDASSAGNWMGMFFARRVGERIQVLDPGGRDDEMNGEVFIADGSVYSGVWQHALLPAA